MGKRSNIIPIFVAAVIILGSVGPVMAGRSTYNDDEPSVTWGSWTEQSGQYKATEENVDDDYRCKFKFYYSGIRTDGDDYYIHIDFVGVSPGWPNAESLLAQYRWGTQTTWTDIAYFDIWSSDLDWLITDATCSTLELRFVDCLDDGDNTVHTWTFDDTPYVIADY